MANDDSEEKTLPASKKKLRQAREKGQVAKSRDLTSGVSLAGSLGLLMLSAATMVAALTAAIGQAGDLAASSDFRSALATLAPLVGRTAGAIVLPFLLIGPLLVVLAAVAMLRGVPFSVDPIVPKMEKINPAEGFKRLFALRSLVELGKSAVKTAVIVSVFVAVLYGGLRDLVLAPACGLGCELGLLRALAWPLFGAALLLFLIAGAADVGLQSWLFRRDQKMSVTEQKRERKDMEGDPHLRRERRRIMRESMRLAGGLGIRRATMLIHDGGSTAVGLRYRINEMPAPVAVCRARADRGASMLAEAREMRLPVAEDRELAEALFRVTLGHGIPETLFRPVALALRRAGMV